MTIMTLSGSRGLPNPKNSPTRMSGTTWPRSVITSPPCTVRTSACVDALRLDDRVERNRVQFVGHAHEQRLDDRQRQRQFDRELACPCRAPNRPRRSPLSRVMFFLTISMPTPRPLTSVTDLGGREARRKDQFHDLAVAGPVVLRQQALFDRSRAHLFDRNPAAVVGDFDDDLIAFVIGVELQRAGARFAARFAHVRRFDAVIDAVAHEVHERFADFVDDRLVEVGVAAVDLELHFFIARFREVAHHPREPVEHVADRHHADFHDRFLDLVGRAREQRRRLGEILGQTARRRSYRCSRRCCGPASRRCPRCACG